MQGFERTEKTCPIVEPGSLKGNQVADLPWTNGAVDQVDHVHDGDHGNQRRPGEWTPGRECEYSITHSSTYHRKRGMPMDEQLTSPPYRVVNRWVDTLILNVKGVLPKELECQVAA